MAEHPRWRDLARAPVTAVSGRIGCVAAPWLAAAALVGARGGLGAALIAALLLAGGGVGISRIAFQCSRRNPFYRAFEGGRFGCSRLHRLALPLALCGVGAGTLWWSGRALGALALHGASAWGWVLGPVLLVVAALFCLAGSACAVALTWGPAIVATTDEEGLEVLAQTLRVAGSVRGLAGSCATIVLAVLVLAVDLTLFAAAIDLWVAEGALAGLLDAWRDGYALPPAPEAPRGLMRGGAALALLHAYATWHCAAVGGYLALRERFDGENLLEREDPESYESALRRGEQPPAEVERAPVCP